MHTQSRRERHRLRPGLRRVAQYQKNKERNRVPRGGHETGRQSPRQTKHARTAGSDGREGAPPRTKVHASRARCSRREGVIRSPPCQVPSPRERGDSSPATRCVPPGPSPPTPPMTRTNESKVTKRDRANALPNFGRARTTPSPKIAARDLSIRQNRLYSSERGFAQSYFHECINATEL